MPLLRHLIRTLFVLLFAAVGLDVALAMPTSWQQISYQDAAQREVVQETNLAFTARAPPTTSENVVAAGTHTHGTDDVHAFTQLASLGDASAFPQSSIATNNATRGADGTGGTTATDLVGDGQSFAGHGAIQANADGTLPTTTIPEGTSLTVPIGPNYGLTDSAGQVIETGDVSAGMLMQNSVTTEGAITYLPGAEVPNYVLFPPDFDPTNIVNPLPNSVIVSQPTNLENLLQPNMGCMNWAACTEVFGSSANPPRTGGFEP